MVRTAEQNENMRETRKENIRIEALHQFSIRGLHATRIQDIAVGAGMSQGLLYHYYPSKEAIYIDLINDALDKMNLAAISIRDNSMPVKEKISYTLQELFTTIVKSDRFRQTCRLIAQATDSAFLPEDEQQKIQEKRKVPYQIMEDVFRTGQSEGSVVDGDPRELTILYWTSINGLSIYYATQKSFEFVPDYRLLAAMFLKN